MTDKEQIEEMKLLIAKTIKQYLQEEGCEKLFVRGRENGTSTKIISEALYNAGYRKVDEGSVVFSKEEYHKIVEQYDKDFDNYKDGENNARVYYENIVIPRLLKQKETNYKIGLGKSQSWVKKLKADIEKLQNENYILAEQVRKETAKEIIDEIKVIKDKAQNPPKNLTVDKFIYFLNRLMDKIADKYGVEIKE